MNHIFFGNIILKYAGKCIWIKQPTHIGIFWYFLSIGRIR